jgi:O-antigen/teichoic acid export membrane protein
MTLRAKAIAGTKWTSISSISIAVLQLFQVIILARYLAPSDFGLMAIVTVIIGFSAMFMDMGISSAIIHNQKITKGQLSSLYWLNLFAGFLLSGIVFILAPYIGRFYNESSLAGLIQLLSLTFIFSALGNQYRILYQKELLFKNLAVVDVISTMIGLAIAVFSAIKGLGVYSLVYGTLFKVISANLVFFYKGIKNHCPALYYSHKEIKGMIGFGMFQMGERCINYFNSQFDTILIGRLLGVESLGVYTIAKTLVMRPAQIINPIVTKVMFPIMARVQDDNIKLKSIYLKTINYLCSINTPIYIAIAILAEPIIVLLFGENWLGATEILQILAIYYILRSTGNPIGALQLAKGRADLGFYWNLLLFVFFPAAIYLGSTYGLKGVAFSLVILSFLFSIPNWYFMVKPLCDAKFKEYFFNILHPVFISVTAASTGLLVKLNISDYWLSYMIFLIVSFAVWLWLNFYFKSLIWSGLYSYCKR